MTTTENTDARGRNAFEIDRDYERGEQNNLLTVRCPEGCDAFGTPDQHEILTTDAAGRIFIWHGRMFGPVAVNALQAIGVPGYDVEATVDDFKSGHNEDAVQAMAQLVEDVTAAHAWMEGLISQ